jgi:uncharacterized protein YxjI
MTPGGIGMLLDHSKFVVKAQSKAFSSRKSFEILEADSGQILATGTDTTGFLSKFFGSTQIEVRDSSNNEVVFSVGRMGMIFKKDQVLDAQGQLLGQYKAKIFSLSGGFHVYDKDGKHLTEIQGNMLKAEYKFLTPDKSTELGSVSRTWGGLAKSLLSGGDTFGVQIDSKFAKNNNVKMLILGATIAIESVFKKEKKEAIKKCNLVAAVAFSCSCLHLAGNCPNSTP